MIALAVAASLAAYIVIGGAAERLLLRLNGRIEPTEDIESLLAAIWPAIPVWIALWYLVQFLEKAFEALTQVGAWLADLPRHLSRLANAASSRWRRRGLHDDCAAAWAWTVAGGEHALGPCVHCTRLIGKRVGRELPRAEVRP